MADFDELPCTTATVLFLGARQGLGYFWSQF